MPQKRILGLDGRRMDKEHRMPTKARLSLALLAMFLLAHLEKHPALAQSSSEQRQLSFATSSLSDGPGTAFQGAQGHSSARVL
jgi:hypothetical protein